MTKSLVVTNSKNEVVRLEVPKEFVQEKNNENVKGSVAVSKPSSEESSDNSSSSSESVSTSKPSNPCSEDSNISDNSTPTVEPEKSVTPPVAEKTSEPERQVTPPAEPENTVEPAEPSFVFPMSADEILSYAFMIYTTNINTEINLKSVEDLSKLKILIEVNNLDKPKKSKIDDFYDIISNLLSAETRQIFYYKSHLYRYWVREKGLDCSRSDFNYYILKHENFAEYFKPKKKRDAVKSETPFGKQAQFDWKEDLWMFLELNVLSVKLILNFSNLPMTLDLISFLELEEGQILKPRLKIL